jgi:cold-inducible RNA-binding protein
LIAFFLPTLHAKNSTEQNPAQQDRSLESLQRRTSRGRRAEIQTVMGNRLYVGNLPFTTTELELQDMFAQAGPVTEVLLMQDKFTGKSRGFAFVTMASETDAQNAVTQLDGKQIEGRPLRVNEARPREERGGGGGGGGGHRGDSRGGGGGGGGYRGSGDRRGGGGGGGDRRDTRRY